MFLAGKLSSHLPSKLEEEPLLGAWLQRQCCAGVVLPGIVWDPSLRGGGAGRRRKSQALWALLGTNFRWKPKRPSCGRAVSPNPDAAPHQLLTYWTHMNAPSRPSTCGIAFKTNRGLESVARRAFWVAHTIPPIQPRFKHSRYVSLCFDWA
jgi:hypothetical protein